MYPRNIIMTKLPCAVKVGQSLPLHQILFHKNLLGAQLGCITILGSCRTHLTVKYLFNFIKRTNLRTFIINQDEQTLYHCFNLDIYQENNRGIRIQGISSYQDKELLAAVVNTWDGRHKNMFHSSIDSHLSHRLDMNHPSINRMK